MCSFENEADKFSNFHPDTYRGNFQIKENGKERKPCTGDYGMH